jgi:hypothetical protein
MEGDSWEEAGTWLRETLERFDCESAGKLSPVTVCKKFNKDMIGTWLTGALSYLEKQHDMVRSLKASNEELKTGLISNQQRVIQLQEELLSSKTDQLQSLQSSVKSSVQDSVKAEFITYSTKLQNPTPIFAPEAVETLVKTVVAEEDRSRSLIIFGLSEEKDEQLCDRVSQVFLDIGEKPRIEASRLGRVCKTGIVRPVKVALSSASTVNQILMKAKNLKESSKYGAVFICPDRSPVQRAQHKQLVAELKQKNNEDKTKRHFIRGGKICSVDT